MTLARVTIYVIVNERGCPMHYWWINLFCLTVCAATVLSGCQTVAEPVVLPPVTELPSPDIAATALAMTAGPATTPSAPATSEQPDLLPVLQEYPVPTGSRPHDVAPAVDGGVWYTAQGSGELGWLDPVTGETRHIALGPASAPHGVIVGPDGAPWITDGGLNAILNTAAFDDQGVLWFTGQSGIYGRLDPAVGKVEVFPAPQGRGPYGITATPTGEVYYASLAGNHIARIDKDNGTAVVLEPPTDGQ